ncbi:aminoglycoside phosphotransferase family protein [Streptomyces sp. N2-109]|uniref:Aminoglycoside phosphotransferase family protein n=1 Tax=Streptomyces gossypii TaxID=2883101 RepID=A0ABT2JL51_9ACTN|nr:aminoglycoside phosphotransferase family protein [Streptomyces gossypii]MCT2588612.1 aminoglycoside phosphotransferase family protein [Streptomyces gossypii]
MNPDSDPGAAALTRTLAGLARARSRIRARTHDSCACGESLLSDRADGTVVRVGTAVAKAHAADTDPAALDVRVRIAADHALAGILLPPLPPAAVARLDGGRLATVWPYGVPVDPDEPLSAPWEAAGTVLARLHAVALGPLGGRLPGALPAMRGPAKAAAALGRMRAATAGRAAGITAGRTDPRIGRQHQAARDATERVWAGLPAWCRAEDPGTIPSTRALCHGDFHLGQLVRSPSPGAPGWRLIDIDDLGAGDPAWDLARPAAWYASGLLSPDAWARMLDAYQEASGTRGSDPWPQLDAPARALTAQSAALAVAKAAAAGRALDEDEEALVESCNRIAQLHAVQGP